MYVYPNPNSEAMERSRIPHTHRTRRPFYIQLLPPGRLRAPTRALLEFFGVLRGPSAHPSSLASPSFTPSSSSANEFLSSSSSSSSSPPPSLRNGSIRDSSSSATEGGESGGEAEVSIRISTVRETEQTRIGAAHEQSNNNDINGIHGRINATGNSSVDTYNNNNSINGINSIDPLPLDTGSNSHLGSVVNNTNINTNTNDNVSNDNSNERYPQRVDFQQLARWIEQVLPFSMLLLMVFIRQHIHGFLVTLWISAVMIKSNDILRKQTALKGERKNLVIIGIGLGMLLQIAGIYCWFKDEDLFRPLLLLCPKENLQFWNAIFIILVNDTLVRQGAMVLKCGLLIHYKKTRGCHYRRQGQLLTFVEYFVLLYRALLPAPVWSKFFFNKEYGTLFSSVITLLYLIFKLTSVLEKLQTFFAALKALAGREVQYGSYATAEEVVTAGDICAICQEKMHAPILLSCKHVFCEDCVSEWFDREKTCPLCRAVVKPAELRSFSDGSTSLLYQVF